MSKPEKPYSTPTGGVLPVGHVSKEPIKPANSQKRRSSITVEALRRARMTIPAGEFCVDAEALRQARQATPGGELHSPTPRSAGGCVQSNVGGRCLHCGQRHLPEACPTVTLAI